MRLSLLLILLAGCTGPDTSIAKHDVDDDNDGYNVDVDCDDARASVNPDAPEVCDGVDNDCDGATDEDATDAATWYADADDDGWGDAATPLAACEAPEGHVADATDCDDNDATAFPGNPEVCDGVDNNCDGATDDDVADAPTWYLDDDGDGWGDGGTSLADCEAPEGYVADATDCDDTRSDVHPEAEESDCTDPTDYNCDGSVAFADADADGWAACRDCDDAEAARNPGLEEVCDEVGVDEDCDGLTDDEDNSVTGTTPWYRDADGDGWAPGTDTPVEQCAQPAGYVADTGDCDDTDRQANPGETEVCDPSDVDEDCDGLTDDDDPSTDPSTWETTWADRDGDGFGDTSRPVSQCDAPAGYVTNDDDCADDDRARTPDAEEVCDAADLDEDCDGLTDDADPDAAGATVWYRDADGDGWGGTSSLTACAQPSGYVRDTGDCDDTRAEVHPDATEVCDSTNRDEDCDGLADDADPSVSGRTTWYRDGDGDGHAGATSTLACDQPAGTAATTTDCDDGNPAVSPSSVEVCDAADVDEDCDGSVDDADPSSSGKTTFYRDADGDGHGGTSTTQACALPAGYRATSTDCDDTRADVSPAGAEVCDAANTDEDCDGLADDADASASGETSWYRDADRDSYGDPASASAACDPPAGFVATGTDCDDGDASVGANRTWWRDADSDGYGTATTTAASCTAPAGYVGNDDDCNDASAAVSPADAEVCDAANTDEDCDGLADDADSAASGTSVWYRDADNDTYGSTSLSTAACDPPAGYRATSGDCNDASAAVNPAATEVCDAANTDEDCDGLADDADSAASGTSTWYADADTDGYGDASTNVSRCDTPAGYVSSDDDCDDTDADALPGGVEVCGDGVDQDCSGADEVCEVPGYAGAYDIDEGYSTMLYAEGTSVYFGNDLAVGDFDGDGQGDLAASATGLDADYPYTYGSVLTFAGPLPTGELSALDVLTTRYAHSMRSYSSTVGAGMANLGDVDGDGKDDLGIPRGSGLVYLVAGGETGNVDIPTAAEDDDACWGVEGGGQLDRTASTKEWLCLDFAYSSSKGVVYVKSGLTAPTTVGSVVGDSATDYLGYAAAGGADVDGDGYDDLLVAAPYDDAGASDAGTVYLFYGPITASWTVASADAEVRGSGANNHIGESVSYPGDLDDDGYHDVLIGAPGADWAAGVMGEAYLFYGPMSGSQSDTAADALFVGASSQGYLGYATAGGDIDGDGVDDLVLGEPAADRNGDRSGSAYLFYGPLAGSYDAATDPSASFHGFAASQWLGTTLAVLPDADGDGDDELVFGAPATDQGVDTRAGVVWVWPGD